MKMVALESGVKVGHYQHRSAPTGCTVFLFSEPNRAVASVLGRAPGEREVSVLHSGNLVESVDAIFFSGGSAFGLCVGEGVVSFLRERGKGFLTKAGPVPIVSGAVIYDLEVSEGVVPTAEWGYLAAQKASFPPQEGSVGAGAGATVGKALGMSYAMKGGFGWSRVKAGEGYVDSFVVCNALGDVYDPFEGRLLAGVRGLSGKPVGFFGASGDFSSSPFNTTLLLLFFSFELSREELEALSKVVHSALALCVRPLATLYDGDLVFLVAGKGGKKAGYLEIVRAIYESVGKATVNAVCRAQGIRGIPAYSDIMF